jgi:hypothetical protein
MFVIVSAIVEQQPIAFSGRKTEFDGKAMSLFEWSEQCE